MPRPGEGPRGQPGGGPFAVTRRGGMVAHAACQHAAPGPAHRAQGDCLGSTPWSQGSPPHPRVCTKTWWLCFESLWCVRRCHLVFEALGLREAAPLCRAAPAMPSLRAQRAVFRAELWAGICGWRRLWQVSSRRWLPPPSYSASDERRSCVQLSTCELGVRTSGLRVPIVAARALETFRFTVYLSLEAASGSALRGGRIGDTLFPRGQCRQRSTIS